jgi:hypothetical protein
MFFFSGLSYLVYELPLLIGDESLWTPLNFAGRLLYMPAPVLLAAFTRRVFRPEGAWAAWFVYGTAALMVGGVAGSAIAGEWEGFSLSNRWFWLEWSGYTVPFAWAGVEALLQHRQAQRRRRTPLARHHLARLLPARLVPGLDRTHGVPGRGGGELRPDTPGG